MDTKIWNNFPPDLTFTFLLIKRLTQAGDCFKFWGLLWKPELSMSYILICKFEYSLKLGEVT